MSSDQESVPRTIGIAVCIALVCSALVTTAVNLLEPMQTAYAAIERNRAIAMAAGSIAKGAEDDEVVEAYLDLVALVIDLDSGEINETLDGHGYDHWAAPGAGQSRYAPVYLKFTGGMLNRVVLPVHGEGMWSTLYGYLALGADFNTVAGLVIHDIGETPGIGDRIQEEQWLAGWAGKRARDEAGVLRLDVSAESGLALEHRVDVITGATITSQAVGRMVRNWLDDGGYARALEMLKAAHAVEAAETAEAAEAAEVLYR